MTGNPMQPAAAAAIALLGCPASTLLPLQVIPFQFIHFGAQHETARDGRGASKVRNPALHPSYLIYSECIFLPICYRLYVPGRFLGYKR
jgi:hypothetical protein